MRPLAAPSRRPPPSAVGGDRRPQRAAGALPDLEGDRGEHPSERRARRRRRDPDDAGLGDGLRARQLRQGSDRARAEYDAEPARRLHRPFDEPPHRGAQPLRNRGREGCRGRARDRHLPRDHLAARPPRPPRRQRTAGRRGGADADDLERRPLGQGAPLRRPRRRTGPSRLADEGPDPEHAPVEGDREAAQVSFGEGQFREDGAAAVDWVASYLERLRDFPVLAPVEPGELRSRLPAAAPETGEAFAAILSDLDDVLLPAVTHWQSPRFFAYFVGTASEPGILAELLMAGLNQVGILRRTSPALQELEEPALASSSAPSTRTRPSRRHASCSTSSSAPCRSTTRSGCGRMRSTSRAHAPPSRRSGRRPRARSTPLR